MESSPVRFLTSTCDALCVWPKIAKPMAPHPRPIVILGPTAGGKSQLAARLAQVLDGQVIGADSMQVYRHLDAGTAKPSSQLRQRVRHHLIDIVEPTERFTVADWLGRADSLIARMQESGRRPIVVGGTNLYLKALLEGLFDGPTSDPAVRKELVDVPSPVLHASLVSVDPVAAGRIHPNDRKKLIRALEVYRTTGKPISAFQTQWDTPVHKDLQYRKNPILIGLEWDVESINRRINQRVKAMFFPDAVNRHDPQCDFVSPSDDGAIESLPREVDRLENQGLLGPQARQALGYKQVLEFIHGQCSLEKAFEATKIQTRRFAKNQRTWLRRFRSVNWVSAHLGREEDLFQETLRIVKS